MMVWLNRLSRGWLVVVLGCVFVAFLLFVLPQMAERSQSYAAGVGTPDTSLTYTPETLYAMFDAYGPAGRQQYLHGRYTFDLAFLLAYGLFLSAWIGYSFTKVWPTKPDGRGWARVGLAAMGADFVENLSLALIVVIYPRPVIALAALAAIATPVKWILVTLALVLAVVGLLGLLITLLRHRSI